MNFNDIEFRLRHPTVYLDDERREKRMAEARMSSEATADNAPIPHVRRSRVTCLLIAVTRNGYWALSSRQE